MRGMGTVYRPANSRFWWIQWYRNGKPYRQSSHSNKKRAAEKLLQQKLGEIATHNFIDPHSERLLIRELAEALLLDYEINRRKSLADVKTRWNRHLLPAFGEMKALHLESQHLTAYIAQRQAESAANGTINRELAALKRMFSLAVRAQQLVRAPYIPQLKESNVRKGFVKDAQYHALARETGRIGLWLRAMFEVAYTYGWRKAELLEMRVSQVDLSERTITLEAGETKNDQGRTARMTDEVLHLVGQCLAGKSPGDHVFTREHDARGRKPKVGAIVDFRDDWAKATVAAGCPGLLFHDLRRSGVRNMIRSGITEHVAMRISGHKTASVFRRYDIIDQADIRDAVRKIEHQAERRRQAGLFESGELFPAAAEPPEGGKPN